MFSIALARVCSIYLWYTIYYNLLYLCASTNCIHLHTVHPTRHLS